MSIRTGVVLQLALIAVASLSLLAVFSLKVIETSMERRQVEAAISVAEVVRSAVELERRAETGSPLSSPGRFVGISRYIRGVTLLHEGFAADRVTVEPVGGGASFLLSVHPVVDVSLPLTVGFAGAKGIRVRFYSPDVEKEARYLLGIAGLVIGADVLVIVLFGLFLIDRSVVRPMRRLVSVSEKITEGNYHLRADESQANEVGQLGGSFNRMIAAILAAQERAGKARQESFRSEKLATVGRLAAGVAHEVGNPLMAIRGYAEYLMRGRIDAAERDECLGKIVTETRKIESIVRGLLSVAAPAQDGENKADVNAVVRETVEMLSFRKMFRDVEVRVEYGDVCTARIIEERFRQVLLNLLINAVDAVDGKGSIHVRTFTVDSWVPKGFRAASRRATDPPDVDVLQMRMGVSPGRGVAVSVADTGCGIPAGELQAIFDPFYTTKDPGKGTGLGLSVSRTIVEAAGGEILVESEEGKGSKFVVIVPAGIAENAGGGPADASSAGRGNG